MDVNRKKICFVVTVSRTANMFLIPQFIVLMQYGWEVTLICAEDPESPLQLPEGVRYLPMPFARGMSFLNVPLTIFRLHAIFQAEQFTIVQYSNPNAALSASIASLWAGIRTRLYAQWGIRYVGFSGFSRRVVKLIEKITCSCSSLVEPDSQSNLDFAVAEGLYPRSKGRLIWNGSACGVDLGKFDIRNKHSWRKAYREKHGIGEGILVIGFLGTMRRDKGANELFQACRELFRKRSDALLLAVGYMSFFETIDADLRHWFETSPQVVYIPPTADVAQYMSCMDIFTLPSYREGFGLVIVEAEAMGVPVVVSDIPGPTDAIEEGITGLKVPVKDAVALQQALETLLDDAATRLRYGAQAVHFARTHFERGEFFRRIAADKESLLSER